MREILIGIDDTDNPTSPGTGRLARDLCRELVKRGLKSPSVTRHQFLVDCSIPYTSHNSGACVAIESDDIRAVDFAFDYIACISAKGSDPGVCIAFSEDVSEEVFNFGKAAQQSILRIEQSFEIARNSNIILRGLGGNCLGVIGALASVGLRARGNDGRFIDMPGLRELPRKVSYERLEEIGIELVYRDDKRLPDKNDIYDTLDWARPRLINNKPVLIMEWSEKEDAWIPVDRKKSKSSQHSTKPAT
ncbi:MAG: hypothetical protein JW715_10225 [Sedimentisphaerales bacterium]|nr:hypothetical protein [Sedimentisphaerales bacterium]